jgi:hypothetical protein
METMSPELRSLAVTASVFAADDMFAEDILMMMSL